MSQNSIDILLYCEKTTLAKKTELIWGAAGKKTTTTHPTFPISVEFGESKATRYAKCPHCQGEVGYKAYRFEFNLKKAMKWAGLLIGVSLVLFFLAIFLMAFGGWEVDPAMWYFGAWGLIGFFLGVGLLVVQLLRYLTFYTKNKVKFIFALTGFSTKHLMMDHRRGSVWRKLLS